MFAVVNTIESTDLIVGHVISAHHSIEAAERAEAKEQRAVKRYNSDNSYLPTRIVETERRVRKGDCVNKSELVSRKVQKIYDLKLFAKRQARIEFADYSGHVDAWNQDKNRRRVAREAAKKEAGYLWHQPDAPLVPGEYFRGRLTITHDSIEYTVGQYAPTEIYWALEDYFSKVGGQQ